MLSIGERMTQKLVDTEIAKRRLRLGATLISVTREVQWEVYKDSLLPQLFQQVIDWSKDDLERVSTEAKLLNFKYTLLLVAPRKFKLPIKQEVEDLVHGFCVVKATIPLAWILHLNWQDIIYTSEYPARTVSSFQSMFKQTLPAKALDDVLRNCNSSSFIKEVQDVTVPKIAPDFVIFPSKLPDVQNLELILTLRVEIEELISLKRYSPAITVIQKTQGILKEFSQNCAVDLPQVSLFLNQALAQAYLQFQAPEHHDLALQLVESVLNLEPHNLLVLKIQICILIEREAFEDARKLTSNTVLLNETDAELISLLGWIYIQQKLLEEGRKFQYDAFDLIKQTKLYEKLIPLVWWRIGQSYNGDFPDDHTKAYEAFENCLKNDPYYAPAFTGLGIILADTIGDQDRAFKCFQRAFELDPGEVQAAERLAEIFATNTSWDLVELVVSQVLESPSKRIPKNDPFSWPYRARGISSLYHKNYSQAIINYQTAIRKNRRDFSSWIGLGEAYKCSGRYLAAEKSFSRASILKPGSWHSKYLLGSSQLERYDYEGAYHTIKYFTWSNTDKFRSTILISRICERWASDCLSKSKFTQAILLANECLDYCKNAIRIQSQSLIAWSTMAEVLQTLMIVRCDAPKDFFINLEIVQPLYKDTAEMLYNTRRHIENITSHKLKTFASARYNTGISGLIARKYNISTWPMSDTEIMECFKDAITCDSRRIEYWNGLSISLSAYQPIIAERAFARALILCPRSWQIWMNLALFYLKYGDSDLAGEALDKGLVFASTNTSASTVRGILSELENDQHSALTAFEIVSELCPPDSQPIILTLVQARLNNKHSSKAELMLSAFQIQKYIQYFPDHYAVILLLGHLYERLGMEDDAYAIIHNLCQYLETLYEELEDTKVIQLFVFAQSTRSRLLLRRGELDNAVECVSMGLALSLDRWMSAPDIWVRTRIALCLVAGQIYSAKNDVVSGQDNFSEAMTLSNFRPEIIMIASKCLWPLLNHKEKTNIISQFEKRYSILNTVRF